mmetsp:Transcript_36642/g.101774  ORF Transcript_36642/g.101774 Transcript_36642/m.101774 type:complete len:262 (-) Transcript_36642:337-1122(-)
MSSADRAASPSSSALCSSRWRASRTPRIRAPPAPSSSSRRRAQRLATAAIGSCGAFRCPTACRVLRSSWKSSQSEVQRWRLDQYMRRETESRRPCAWPFESPRKPSLRRPPPTTPKMASLMPCSRQYPRSLTSGRRSSREYCTWLASICMPSSTSAFRLTMSMLQPARCRILPSSFSWVRCRPAFKNVLSEPSLASDHQWNCTRSTKPTPRCRRLCPLMRRASAAPGSSVTYFVKNLRAGAPGCAATQRARKSPRMPSEGP